MQIELKFKIEKKYIYIENAYYDTLINLFKKLFFMEEFL